MPTGVGGTGIEKVVVHPLVLLSVTDHYNRVAKDTNKRVVGVLLGSLNRGQLDVTNSYAVPFEEDERDPNIWFLDHSYHENMFGMFKRINAREQVVGWYSTGPKLREGDMAINDLFTSYCENPVLVIVQVGGEEGGIPTSAYVAVEDVKEAQSEQAQKSFSHLPSEIGAHESEEVGVEHLLRDVKGATPTDLASKVLEKVDSLRGLETRLREVANYLDKVLEGQLPANQEALAHLQNAFSVLPSLEARSLSSAFASRTNDNMLAMYLASLIRSIIALHDLINNKSANKERERSAEAKTSSIPTSQGQDHAQRKEKADGSTRQ